MQAPDARLRIDARFGYAEADRKAIDRPFPQQRDEFAPTRHFRNEPPAREQAAESSRSSSQMPTGSEGLCWNSIGIRRIPREASVSAKAPRMTMSRAGSISPNRLA